jgi:hypothetical protein
MKKVINILIIIVYIILLAVSIWELISLSICENQSCSIFKGAFEKTGTKNQVLFLLDKLCEDSVWPFAYISSSIIAFLLFALLPIPLTFIFFVIVFLITFITFYCILSFFVYHYVIPIKKFIIDYIQNI